MKIAIALLCASLAQGSGLEWGAAAAPLPPAGSFVYSNACKFDSGDFEGYRVSLTRTATGIAATVEFNDVGAEGHAAAGGVKFNSATGDLRFSFQGAAGDLYAFDGAVSADKLVGSFNARLVGDVHFSRGRTLTLPLVKTGQKTLPACRF